jgi:hypothetical protein
MMFGAKKDKEEREWAEKTALRKAALDEVIEHVPVEERAELQRSADILSEIAADLAKSIASAASLRRTWHNIGQFGAAASSVTAAGSGGALTAGLGGSGGVIFGVVALTMGLIGGVATAVGANSEYARQRHKARRYEQLWWDIWIYTVNDFATATASQRSDRLSEFVRVRAQVGDPDAATGL